MKNQIQNQEFVNHDIKLICLDIMRDLYSASRKLMMYPIDHPLTNDTLKKPFGNLNEIFKFKRSFVVQTYSTRLITEGLLLEDNVFVNGILMDLAKHKIISVEFTSDLQVGDLYYFLNRLVQEVNPTEDYFQRYLAKSGVNTIIINGPDSKTLFNFNDTVIGLRNSKYRLFERIDEVLQNNPAFLTSYYIGEIKSDEDVVTKLGLDLRLTYLRNHFGPIVATMTEEQALEVFKGVIYSASWLDEQVNEGVLEGLQKLWNDYSHRSEDVSILLPIYDIFKTVGATDDILELVFNKGAMIKLKAVRDAEQIIGFLRKSQAREIDFQLLRKTIFKLATDFYSGPLEQLLAQLLKCISAADLDTRQRSLRLTIEALRTLSDGSFWEPYGAFIKEIMRVSHSPHIGIEVIELIGWIIDNAAENNRWEEFKICSQTLKALTRDKSDYKNRIASDRLREIAESSILNDILIEAVISGKNDRELYDAIAALASSKTAAALIAKIDSPDKTVRARTIKALVSMGKGIGPEVTRGLAEIVSRGETDDDGTWFKLRNLLRVLGQIQYVEALPYFDILAGWKQGRLKHEIISACESLKSSSTGAILSKLALDSDQEVSKSAIIAMGSSGHPDMVKFLRVLFDNGQVDRELIISSLGRLGGLVARNILIDLYENENLYEELKIGKKEKQKIQIAILKALAKIGDDVSRSKIELYVAKHKSSFFKKDAIAETAAILLDKTKK